MDNSPTSLFDSYENEFTQFIDTINDKLEEASKDGDAEARLSTLRRTAMDLDEADEMLSQMQIELPSIPQSLRAPYQQRLGAAKSTLAGAKRRYKEIEARVALLGSRSRSGGGFARTSTSDDPYGDVSSDRARLLAGTAKLDEGTRRLEESQRIAMETEQTGADILLNLRGQREQIEHARDTLGTAERHIDRASGTLKGMIRRMYQQRFITAGIIGVLLLLIALILYSKLS
ncbi:V-snare-domain-containing protein [Schizophyllum commune H4-8]|uniref:V-snare-domain-containing protein n=1 Tax=Schizophyllum commune (strain H4-8 / FGSC 9210) TaxID=578458 RepID=UPI00215EAC30|nr:V-snare-domain-containing protein [Schizophyllum commune H4-8]KAI5893738.1 V-snare-domain-containing protein [Schizophyllum commune H4-8]